MKTQEILPKINKLPINMQIDVIRYVDKLTIKNFKKSNKKVLENRKPGSAKGKIIMTAEFDEPLDCFSDYI